MENSQISENGDSAKSYASRFFMVPKLTEKEMYHVFISTSTADSTWVKQLIRKLEATFPDIKICFHDRDFTAGKTIIENMTECIQRSQKVLMVLSPDFVHSRWCLFEANLSMFQECMSHKAIVPVMLKPCPMPLYIRHLTYLEVRDKRFFEKLCNRLLKNNAKETEDVLVHFQPSIQYGAKHLLSLPAVNKNCEEHENGAFPETCVPDSLKEVMKDPEIYTKAIRLINNTPPYVDIFNYFWIYIFLFIYMVSLISFILISLGMSLISIPWWYILYLLTFFFPTGILTRKMWLWRKHRPEKIVQNMSRNTGEANLLLAETSLLAGCASKSSLVFVFVSLQECKDVFYTAFGSDAELAKCMWKKAMIRYSSNYANCITNNHFPRSDPRPPGHLVHGICFCQYVAMQIEQGD